MYNYSKSFLEKVAKETGFIRDNLEKVFRLCNILQFVNTHAVLKEYLVLKGGTAINLTVFNIPRLSVDIDLDFSKACRRDEMINVRKSINDLLLNYMFSQGYALSPNTKNPHSLDSWVFYFQNAGGNKDNIKIEINYSMRNHILPLTKNKVKVEYLKVEDEWTTLSPIELFGGKIKALMDRAAPRDLYDVGNMINNNIIQHSERDLLHKIVLFYLVLGSKKMIAYPFDFENINAIEYYQIRTNLVPVLKKNEPFDFVTAKTTVMDYLSRLMILSENEKLFVDKFNQGIYQPDLLFDDEGIIARIKEHPMAIWKTREK
jgi:predicted nucleotidyltransferase component of viral defense system